MVGPWLAHLPATTFRFCLNLATIIQGAGLLLFSVVNPALNEQKSIRPCIQGAN